MKKTISLALVLLLLMCMFPACAFAADPSPTMDPKKTNELYEGLKDGYKQNALSEEIEGVAFDESMLWGVFDWSRAWLITSLCMDLQDNNEQIYNKYVPTASKYYIALVPPLFEEDDPYSYQIIIVDGTNALGFLYTPGSKYCSYTEYNNISQENIENLSLLSVIVWEVTEADFNSLNEVINNGTETIAGSEKKETSKASSTPMVTLSRSEIEDKAAMALVIKLMYGGDYSSKYNIDATGYRVDSVITTNDGWDVKGTVILYDFRNNESSHTFRVHIDSEGSAGLCEIS